MWWCYENRLWSKACGLKPETTQTFYKCAKQKLHSRVASIATVYTHNVLIFIKRWEHFLVHMTNWALWEILHGLARHLFINFHTCFSSQEVHRSSSSRKTRNSFTVFDNLRYFYWLQTKAGTEPGRRCNHPTWSLFYLRSAFP